MSPEKRDFKKELKHLYGPRRGAVVEVEVTPMRYFALDGEGDPNTAPAFREAVEALFSLSYTVKFAVKKEGSVDYGVMPLEGLWWTDDGKRDAADIVSGRDDWRWTVMIMQPDELVTDEHFERAVESVGERKDLPALSKVRFERLHEGRVAQTLHVGPFADEWPTIERVHEFIEESGGRLTGKHHEIYLSDFRRAAPQKLRTIIRQPFAD